MKPVEVGDIIKGEVVDINFQGKGVVKKDNFTIFTDSGVYGDLVEIEIVKVKKNFALASTKKIIKPSAIRIKSNCKYSKECGGCQLQEIEYLEELKLKEDTIKNDLKRIGKLDKLEILDIIPMENPYRYRNNVQIPVVKSGGKTLIGHYEKDSHRVVDTYECIIQEEVADRLVSIFREFMDEENITTYYRRQHRGLVRHIVIRTSKLTKDTMVIIVINGKNLKNIEKLIEKFKQVDEFKSLYLNVNTKRTNQVMGEKFKHMYGEKKIIDKIGDLSYRISPESFFQVNTSQAEKLYDSVRKLANLSGEEILVDLYSGIGTIGLYLADSCKEVVGVEIIGEAVKDARENARINNIKNAAFFQAKSEQMLPELEKMEIRADVLVVDPPRKGCDQDLLDHIGKYKPEKIVYVSCNPATLARDIDYLKQYGYLASKVQPVDMFPRTTHVECVALLQREIS